MAGNISNGLETDFLCMVTGQATTIITTTPLAEVWLRLTTDTPSDSVNGTEPTTTDYDPIDTKGDWAAPSSGSVANDADLDYGTATETWEEIVGFELWTDDTGGSRLVWGVLTTPQTPAAGNPVKFPVGALVITAN